MTTNKKKLWFILSIITVEEALVNYYTCSNIDKLYYLLAEMEIIFPSKYAEVYPIVTHQ